ncbi:LysR family transcriptional regulator [Komagataeibacter xylinus]|uniref:LysR family transcriptional regulator n=1 Tax=Komagataeibacter xylinus TaxID=28448 RepID=A0A857FM76_KOMXY|nr:LysR family transcriptional regulator [Komagataeibacter xylinus]QHC35296.1 LysR family transcriptional regulator [Komagataeibacter xylinus]
MDTRFLETFLVVIERGSLAEAARHLNVTSAAIAQRIHAVEEEIGLELLHRNGRTVRPTDHAAAIIDQARSILQQVRDLRTIAALDKPSGKLRVGAISTALTGILPQALGRFFHLFPDIELHVIPGSSSSLYEQLRDGTIDAAFIVHPPFELPKIFEWHNIRSEPLIVIAPPDEKRKDPFRILRSHHFLRYDRNHWGGRQADTYMTQHQICPREQLELDSLEAIALMVNAGIGASLVPDWAPPWPEGITVSKISLPASAPGPMRHVGLIWPSTSSRTRLINRLLQIFR